MGTTVGHPFRFFRAALLASPVPAAGPKAFTNERDRASPLVLRPGPQRRE